MKRFLTKFTTLLALAFVTLTACGPTGPQAEQPVEATPSPTVALPEPLTATSTTLPMEPTILPLMPGMPTNLCAQPPNVINFDVWQDFMPGPKSGNPLHASLTLELQYPDTTTSVDISGSITLRRTNGEEIIASPLQLDSIDDTTTSGVKQLSLTMQSLPPSGVLTEGELVTGTASLIIGQDRIEIQLPETKLLFTR